MIPFPASRLLESSRDVPRSSIGMPKNISPSHRRTSSMPSPVVQRTLARSSSPIFLPSAVIELRDSSSLQWIKKSTAQTQTPNRSTLSNYLSRHAPLMVCCLYKYAWKHGSSGSRQLRIRLRGLLIETAEWRNYHGLAGCRLTPKHYSGSCPVNAAPTSVSN